MPTWLVVPTIQYMDDRAKFDDDARLLKDLSRAERQLSRDGVASFKEAHRVGDTWTIYLSQGRRLLVRPEGQHLQLVGLGVHDDVYRDLKRRSPDSADVGDISIEPVGAPPEDEETTARFLFEALPDEFLGQIGVLPAQVPLVRSFVTEDDLWMHAPDLGEDLSLRLSYCTNRPPAQVLDEYLKHGRDDEALELAARAEADLGLERSARAQAVTDLAEAKKDAQQAQDEASELSERLEAAEAQLAAAQMSAQDSPKDTERLQRLESEVERLDELVNAAYQRVSQTQTASVEKSSAVARSLPIQTVRTSSRVASGSTPGSTWTKPRGRERWRLSPTSRSLTRLSDGSVLQDLVGTATAAQLVSDFLRVRPEGGRVWVDEAGNACTLRGSSTVYLGRLRSQAPAAVRTSPGRSLSDLLVQAVAAAPNSTARELVYELRRLGLTTVTRTDVNSLLYRQRGTYVRDASSVPRWRLLAATPSRQAPVSAPSSHPRSQAPRTAYSSMATRPPTRPGAKQATAAPRPRIAQVPPGRPRPQPAQTLALMTWQQEAMTRWYEHGCHGIVEAVTGTGKTHLGLEAAAHAAVAGRRTTVLVPSVDLQEQWISRFQTFLPDLRLASIGGTGTGDPRTADVFVSVVNSALTRDLTAFGRDSLLVADEVHRYGSESFQYALRANYSARLGLTATLERSDDAVDDVLLPYFGTSIMTVDFGRAIREEVVAPFQLILAPVGFTEEEEDAYETLSQQISNSLKILRNEGALSGAGNLVQQLGRLRATSGRVGRAARTAESSMRARRRLLAALEGKSDAIEELSELVHASQGTVIFTQTKEVAEDAALRLREWGITASALYGEMPKRERRENLDGLTNGRLQALAAPQLLDEGIDVPTVDLGIVMTASRSRRQMVQRLGRIIRKKDDGRPVRFVLLYADGTVEDPNNGVHEGFFDLVGDVATDRLQLKGGWTADDLISHQPAPDSAEGAARP